MQDPGNKVRLLSSLSGRRKLCVLGLRLQRLEITEGKWGRRKCSAFWTTAIKRPLSAPSISESISTPSLPHHLLSPAYARIAQSSLSVQGIRQPPPGEASIQNPVDGSGSRDLEEWINLEAMSSQNAKWVDRAGACDQDLVDIFRSLMIMTPRIFIWSTRTIPFPRGGGWGTRQRSPRTISIYLICWSSTLSCF